MGVATQKQVDALFNVGGRKLKGNEYIASVEETMVMNITSLLDKLGIELVKKLEQNTPVASGRLSSSYSVVGVTEKNGSYRLEIGVGADYADYIDKGVKGIVNKRKQYPKADGKYYQFKTYGMPPEALKSLEGWAARKNIELKGQHELDKFNGKMDRLKLITSPASRLAYYIKKYGIEGRNFKQKSIDEVTPNFNISLKELGANSLMLKLVK